MIKDQQVIDINNFKSKAAIIVWAVSGAAVLVLLPIIVGAMADNLILSSRDLGFLAAADMLGAAIGTLVISPRLDRIKWRGLAAVSILIMVVANILSVGVEGFAALICLRLFAGTGQGIAMGAGVAAMAKTKNPDGLIAAFAMWALLFGAAGIYLSPLVLQGGSLDAVFWALAVIAAVSLPCIFWIPNTAACDIVQAPGVVAVNNDALVKNIFKWAAVFAVLSYFMAQGAIWAYIERMAVARHMSIEDISIALGVCSLFGAAGAFTAVLLSNRIGRLKPLLISTVFSIAGLIILLGDFDFLAYTLAASLFNFGWNFTYPYQLAAIGYVDSTTRLVATAVAMQTLGLAVGPAVVGLFINGDNYTMANWLGGGWIVLSILLIAPVALAGDRND